MKDDESSLENIEKYLASSETRLVYSLDNQQSYTVNMIKGFYITTLYSAETVAQKLNIDLNWLKKEIAALNWDQERKNNKEKILELINNKTSDAYFTILNDHLRIQKLTTIQYNQKVEWLEKYLKDWGDLFARDPETKELLSNYLGQPTPLKLPTGKVEIENKLRSVTFLEGLKKLLIESLDLDVGSVSKKAQFLDVSDVQLDDYDLFLPKK